jgi:hypothetical protein
MYRVRWSKAAVFYFCRESGRPERVKMLVDCSKGAAEIADKSRFLKREMFC